MKTFPTNWPPLDGDLWTDGNNVKWFAQTWEADDELRCALHQMGGKTSATPDRVLELAAPLTLAEAGWERLRNERMAAEFASQPVGGLR